MYPSGHFWIGYEQQAAGEDTFEWSDGSTGSTPTWTGNFEGNTFDGGDANVELPIESPQGAAPRRYKIEFRTTTKTTGRGQGPVLLSTGTATTAQAFNVRLNALRVDQIGVMGYGWDTFDYDVDSPVSVTDGNWHTLVVDYDGATLRMWVDGLVVEAGKDFTYNTVGQNNWVGKSNHVNNEGYFNGDIRYVSFWSASSGSLQTPATPTGTAGSRTTERRTSTPLLRHLQMERRNRAGTKCTGAVYKRPVSGVTARSD